MNERECKCECEIRQLLVRSPSAGDCRSAFLPVEPGSPATLVRAGTLAKRRRLPECLPAGRTRPLHPPALRSGFPSGNLARIEGIKP